LQEVIGVLSSWYYLLSSCPDEILCIAAICSY
jgi:hypothetical protein